MSDQASTTTTCEGNNGSVCSNSVCSLNNNCNLNNDCTLNNNNAGTSCENGGSCSTQNWKQICDQVDRLTGLPGRNLGLRIFEDEEVCEETEDEEDDLCEEETDNDEEDDEDEDGLDDDEEDDENEDDLAFLYRDEDEDEDEEDGEYYFSEDDLDYEDHDSDDDSEEYADEDDYDLSDEDDVLEDFPSLSYDYDTLSRFSHELDEDENRYTEFPHDVFNNLTTYPDVILARYALKLSIIEAKLDLIMKRLEILPLVVDDEEDDEGEEEDDYEEEEDEEEEEDGEEEDEGEDEELVQENPIPTRSGSWLFW